MKRNEIIALVIGISLFMVSVIALHHVVTQYREAQEHNYFVNPSYSPEIFPWHPDDDERGVYEPNFYFNVYVETNATNAELSFHIHHNYAWHTYDGFDVESGGDRIKLENEECGELFEKGTSYVWYVELWNGNEKVWSNENDEWYFTTHENLKPHADAGGPYQIQVGKELTVNASESYDADGEIICYRWDFDNDGVYEGREKTDTVTFNDMGTKTIKLLVVDDNNDRDTATASVEVQENPNQEPVADAGGPYSGDVHEMIELDGGDSYDPDGEILQYEWDVYEFGGYELEGEKTYVDFGEAGTYQIKLRVTDDGGKTDVDETTVYIETNTPPTADADGPYNASVGETVTLDGSGSSDPDGSIVSYDWDVDGDGIYDMSGETASLAYSSTGTRDITLRVTDDKGATDVSTTTATIGGGTNGPGDGNGGEEIIQYPLLLIMLVAIAMILVVVGVYLYYRRGKGKSR